MSDTEPAAPSLPVLMARVLGDLPSIGKDEQAPGSMGGYNFRGIEAITAALKPLLAKHEVFCVPTTLERIDGGRAVGNSKTMWVVDVHVQFTFYGPAGDSLTCSTWGEGTDMGDKATQKAYTSAFKSMLGQVFCIADSATDSERHEVPETERAQAPALASSAAVRELGERIKARPEAVRDTIKARMAEAGLSFTRSLTPAELGTIEAWEAELEDDGEPTAPSSGGGDGVPAPPHARPSPAGADEFEVGDSDPGAGPIDPLPPENGTGAHTDTDKAVWRAEVNALGPDDLAIALEDRGLDVGGTEKERRARLFDAGPLVAA